jgi:hypothetical protein
MRWQGEGQPDSYQGFEPVNTPRINRHQQATNALKLQVPVLPQFPERLRRLVNAAYAAYGGAESMTLNDWRDLELQLKPRPENECK